ncbi:MAG: 3D-(3,5/4)-trihydroxycyclohexane-1,2-dione acylhydrolase (decyclizing) [Clostridia bacterium]|nr:3D-(3,5/4)-trihydroxycyclohexane-1,2-dione acylhydrolase (decyclizing) [Clostridia bacterium]
MKKKSTAKWLPEHKEADLMDTVRLTLGEAIVRYLDNQYVTYEIDGEMTESKFVEYFYAVFGHGCVLGVGEALSQAEHSIKVMQGRNEQGMAQAATAYAKMNNRMKIIPCMSSIGPGAANMVTAAATATVNNIPLLLFMGDVFASRQPDPVLQQIEQLNNGTVTTNDAFKAVTRYFDRITRPEMIMNALTNAMRVLTDPAHTGAVAIALCQDVQGESYDYPVEFFRKRVHFIPRQIPCEYEVSQVAQEIKNSKKPLLIVGGGVRYSFAGKEVSEFCEKYNIPFAETQAGKSAIKSSHPLNVGGIGVTGNSSANTLAAGADLIIGVGTKFSDFTTSSKWLYSGARIVTVNASSFHGGKLDSVKMVADAKEGIKALDRHLEGYKTEYTDEITKAKADWDAEMQRLSDAVYSDDYAPEIPNLMPDAMSGFNKATGGEICQTAALALIRKIIPENAVAVGAAGSLPGCMQRMWTTDSINSYNMEYGYSCMGYEIAGAFGSKLACPDREVYAFTGDGSYNMLHSEMLTALQEGKKINVLLFDNASFGCINNLQMGQGVNALCTESRYRNGDEPIREGEFMNIDYAMCAKGYGYVTYTAKTMEELEAALEDSLKQTKPVLIDIKVLPKSMTDGYGGWWNVGCSEMPRTEKGEAALEERKQHLNDARKY